MCLINFPDILGSLTQLIKGQPCSIHLCFVFVLLHGIFQGWHFDIAGGMRMATLLVIEQETFVGIKPVFCNTFVVYFSVYLMKEIGEKTTENERLGCQSQSLLTG